MRFFMSGEIDGRYGHEASEKFSEVREDIEKRIKDLVCDKNYGSEVESIAVIPIIVKFDSNLDEKVWFKERKLFKHKEKEADFRLRIDYDKFLSADKHSCELLIIKNVVESIRILGSRAKKDFNASSLENDILGIFNISKGSIDTI